MHTVFNSINDIHYMHQRSLSVADVFNRGNNPHSTLIHYITNRCYSYCRPICL